MEGYESIPGQKGTETETMEVDQAQMQTSSGESFLSSDDLTVMRDLLELVCEKLSIPMSLMPNPRIIWDKVSVVHFV